jgi:hypothetical protein
MALTPEQIKAIRAVCDAVLDAVRAGGSLGAPGGVIYAALMGQGCTLSQFESPMAGLVRAGKLCRDGDLYFVTGA